MYPVDRSGDHTATSVEDQLMQEMMRKQQIYNQKQRELDQIMAQKESRKNLPKVNKSRLN
jgi:hypothetical protein